MATNINLLNLTQLLNEGRSDKEIAQTLNCTTAAINYRRRQFKREGILKPVDKSEAGRKSHATRAKNGYAHDLPPEPELPTVMRRCITCRGSYVTSHPRQQHQCESCRTHSRSNDANPFGNFML